MSLKLINRQANVIAEQKTLKEFKEICIRRGLKIGRVLGEFIERYVAENGTAGGCK
jgi:hypothetical protein